MNNKKFNLVPYIVVLVLLIALLFWVWFSALSAHAADYSGSLSSSSDALDFNDRNAVTLLLSSTAYNYVVNDISSISGTTSFFVICSGESVLGSSGYSSALIVCSNSSNPFAIADLTYSPGRFPNTPILFSRFFKRDSVYYISNSSGTHYAPYLTSAALSNNMYSNLGRDIITSVFVVDFSNGFDYGTLSDFDISYTDYASFVSDYIDHYTVHGLYFSDIISVSNQPTSAPQPTATPRPTSAPQPTATPRPTSAPQPTATPQPTSSPQPTSAQQPSVTPLPTLVLFPGLDSGSYIAPGLPGYNGISLYDPYFSEGDMVEVQDDFESFADLVYDANWSWFMRPLDLLPEPIRGMLFFVLVATIIGLAVKLLMK